MAADTPKPKPAATKPPASDPPPDPNPAAGHGAAPVTKPPATTRKTTEYLVFEAVEVDKDGPVTLKRIAKDIDAESPKEARWAAAESDEALLARTKPDAEGDPPLLLPIAVRLAEPTATREQQVIKSKRG